MPLPFRLLLVSDRKQVASGSLVQTIEQALAGGVDAVQLREKDLSAADLYALATQLRTLTRRYEAKLLINDRIDIAQAVAADGVHLPASSFSPTQARALLGPEAIIGISTHSVAEVSMIEAGDADYIIFGPIYDTPSKRAYGAALGVEALAAATRAAQVPILAIGGVSAARLDEIKQAGAHGVAVIAAILHATDARGAAAAMRARLNE